LLKVSSFIDIEFPAYDEGATAGRLSAEQFVRIPSQLGIEDTVSRFFDASVLVEKRVQFLT